MMVHAHGGIDRRATGARAVAVCGVVAVIWLVVLACSNVVAWGQVPLGDQYPHVLTLVKVGFWASAAALVVSALVSVLGLRLDARRASWGLLIAAGAFAVLAFRPPERIALLMVAVGAAAAVQAGFYQGELGRLVRFAGTEDKSLGKAQAILNGWFTFGLAPVVWGVAWLAEELLTGLFAVLALACLASFAIAMRLYRHGTASRASGNAAVAPPLPTVAPPVSRWKAGGWSRRTAWGFVANALSSATTAANLATLPLVLAQQGYEGPGWQAGVFATHVPAAAVVLVLWTRLSHRLGDSALGSAAVVQAAGTLVLAMSMWLGSGFIVWQFAGFVLLNAARAAYNGSILVSVGVTGANGTVLLIASGLGAAVGVQFAAGVVQPGGVSPADVGLICGALCLVATVLAPLGALVRQRSAG